jgi:hypothetical protein
MGAEIFTRLIQHGPQQLALSRDGNVDIGKVLLGKHERVFQPSL